MATFGQRYSVSYILEHFAIEQQADYFLYLIFMHNDVADSSGMMGNVALSFQTSLRFYSL